MNTGLSVNIIYNKANTYGLADDIAVIERIFNDFQVMKPKMFDMREAFVHADVNIHLEIPIFSAIPWARKNIMLVNPEQWVFEYDAYAHAFDGFIFRDPDSAEKFRVAFLEYNLEPNIYVVPWCNSWSLTKKKEREKKKNEFVCFIAGSTSKYNYIKKMLHHWGPNDPPLTIYTTRNDFAEKLTSNNVTVICQDLTVDDRRSIMAIYEGHVVCSEGEAFGYAAANAATVGAFIIMNKLPVFEYYYKSFDNVAWISNEYEESTRVRYSIASPTSNVRDELNYAFSKFNSDYTVNNLRFDSSAFAPVYKNIKAVSKSKVYCPPILLPEDCPLISIITPTYNREKLIEIAFHNLLATDYPHDKIEWIVVEDNESKENMYSEKIISFQLQVPNIKLKYIPIEGRMSVGEKRNIGVENASNDIILFMDDDDHYPFTSFRRRVAWLLKGKKGEYNNTIACCTTIALYDLKYGTSAVNVPPFDIPFGQRISEATLTFKKSAWLEKKFLDVSVGEGESWITCREDQVLEMPPQQIIVAFTHGENQSSRKIPPGKPACFWGFPKEYLLFIHKLAGVTVSYSSSSFCGS